MHPRSRLVGVLATLGCLALAGCEADIRLDIGADDHVGYDITFWTVESSGENPPGPDRCEPWRREIDAAAVLTELSDPADGRRWGCHATGRLPAVEARRLARIGRVGDDYAVFLRPPVEPPGEQRYDVTATFPGPVTAADPSATVAGRTVSWSSRTAPGQGALYAVAAAPAASAAPPLAAVAGVVLGAGLTLGAARLRSRRTDA